MNKRDAEVFMEEIFKIFRFLKQTGCYKNDLMQLTLLQVHALIFLSEHTYAQMSEIANHFTIELSSATSLVNKLCTMKLVERQPDAHDRRVIRIIITEKGEKLLHDAMKERVKKVETMLSYLRHSEVKELLETLQTLNSKIATI